MTEISFFLPARRSLGRFAAAVWALAALAVWTGCTKDADAPRGPAGGVETTGPTTDATEDGNGHDAADSGNGTAENSAGTSSPSSATSDEAAIPDEGESSAAGSTLPPVQEQPRVERPGAEQPAVAQPGVEQSNASGIPQPPVPAQVHKPQIILSQHHAQTCLVGVGDQFPKTTLPDLEGNTRELAQLYGDRMTIVVFWTAKGLYAREQFSRVMHECHDRYAPLGVNVVAINVGDSPEIVQGLAARHSVTIPCLLDADRVAFRQAATDLLPRTYLLDSSGRIVWFDLEYSRSQRLELHNAVYYQLKQSGA